MISKDESSNVNDSYTLNSARIKVDASGSPHCLTFNDIYYMDDSGKRESEHVFINGNNLLSRWQQPSPNKFNVFTILELGFGTGLNFFLTVRRWLDTEKKTKKTLHYISLEKFPVSKNHLINIMASWGFTVPCKQEFLDWYPDNLKGTFRIQFNMSDHTKLILDLVHDDAFIGIKSLIKPPVQYVDALFLDGFSPKNNLSMWDSNLLLELAKFCQLNLTTISSFSVASLVKKNLKTAGFHLSKIPGIGKKRENLTGIFKGNCIIPSLSKLTSFQKNSYTSKSWFHQPKKGLELSADSTVAIIGGGLAGSFSAYSLNRLGINTEIIDKNSTLASEASGNHQGVVYTRITKKPTEVSLFHLKGYKYTLQLLNRLQKDHKEIPFWQKCALYQFEDRKNKNFYENLIENNLFPSDLLRVSSNLSNGMNRKYLIFPNSGFVNPPRLCQVLTGSTRCQFKFNTNIAKIVRQGSMWHLISETGSTIGKYPIVIFANAFKANELLNFASYLELKTIRGQVTYLKNEYLDNLKDIYTTEKYLLPPFEGFSTVGASFNIGSNKLELSELDTKENIEILKNIYPNIDLNEIEKSSVIGGRVGFRTACSDYLPAIGAVPDLTYFKKNYDFLRFNARRSTSVSAQYSPGLFLNIAHGSRGLVSAPIASEIIASMVSGQFLPIENNLIDAINPARFIIRKLQKNQL